MILNKDYFNICRSQLISQFLPRLKQLIEFIYTNIQFDGLVEHTHYFRLELDCVVEEKRIYKSGRRRRYL